MYIFALIFLHISFQRRNNKKSSRGSDRVHLDVPPSSTSSSTSPTDAYTYENPADFKTANGPDDSHKRKEIYQNANVSAPVEQADLVYQNIARKQKGQGQSKFDFISIFHSYSRFIIITLFESQWI